MQDIAILRFDCFTACSRSKLFIFNNLNKLSKNRRKCLVSLFSCIFTKAEYFVIDNLVAEIFYALVGIYVYSLRDTFHSLVVIRIVRLEKIAAREGNHAPYYIIMWLLHMAYIIIISDRSF